MFYDGKQIKEDEPYQEPAGKEVMKWHAERPEHLRKAEVNLAKRLQSLKPRVK